ncbi:MAG: uridine kinase [Bacteroidota bacterium]
MVRPLIIGITGGSGSGKTTLLSKLKQRFEQYQMCVISQDDYYRPREEQLIDDQGVKNFDLPDSIDQEAFVKDIERLIAGEVVCRQEYTFNNAEKTAQLLTFEPAPIIIVEGLFVFHLEAVRDLLDIKVFLDAKENLKVIRRIKRDQMERNYPLDDVLYRYEHHVLPTFERYIRPYRDEADIIINNNANFEKGLRVLAGFISYYINKYDNQ